MIYDDRIYADNTILKSAAGCSLQVVLRHVLNWNTVEAAAPLRAGNAAHAAKAEWARRVAIFSGNQDEARVAALKVYEREYKQYSDENVSSEDRLSYANTSAILDEWLTTKAPRLPFAVKDPRLIEVGFAYPLDASGRRVFFGRMDSIGNDLSPKFFGDWVVEDLKTTGRIDAYWSESWGLDTQVTGYYWAALQHVPNFRGFYIDGIEFSLLPHSDRTCREHGLPYFKCSRAHMKSEVIGPISRTPEQLETWRTMAIALVDKYAFYAEHYNPEVVGTTPNLSNVEVEGPFTGACRFCSFRRWCLTGQHPAMLPGLFIQDPWMPYDPRQFEELSPATSIGLR